MHTRVVVGCALAAALSVSAAAGAAPRKVCKLLGPGTTETRYQTLGDNAVRLTSADLASDRRHLTAVVRLASATDTTGPAARGRIMKFYFSRSDTDTYLFHVELWDARVTAAHFGTSSQRYDTRSDGSTAGGGVERLSWLTDDVRVVVDRKANEVRMTVPTRVLGAWATARPRPRVDFLAAAVHRIHGVSLRQPGVPELPKSFAGISEQVAVTNGNDRVAYVLGTPSCVVPGR